jgi:hypothetical protein
VDLRYFELHDLLCEAVIALEAGDTVTAATTMRKALKWAESDWLATPSELPTPIGPSLVIPDDEDDD